MADEKLNTNEKYTVILNGFIVGTGLSMSEVYPLHDRYCREQVAIRQTRKTDPVYASPKVYRDSTENLLKYLGNALKTTEDQVILMDVFGTKGTRQIDGFFVPLYSQKFSPFGFIEGLVDGDPVSEMIDGFVLSSDTVHAYKFSPDPVSDTKTKQGMMESYAIMIERPNGNNKEEAVISVMGWLPSAFEATTLAAGLLSGRFYDVRRKDFISLF